MVLDLKMKDYVVKKGFLAQAKRLEPGKKLNSAGHRKLRNQCRKMLAVTPSSMVFLYHTQGLTAIPALAVLSAQGRDLWQIPRYDASYVYRDFAICWFGDTRIRATDPRSLAALKSRLSAQAAIRIIGREFADGKRVRQRGRQLDLD
jgi:hypothetical protein